MDVKIVSLQSEWGSKKRATSLSSSWQGLCPIRERRSRRRRHDAEAFPTAFARLWGRGQQGAVSDGFHRTSQWRGGDGVRYADGGRGGGIWGPIIEADAPLVPTCWQREVKKTSVILHNVGPMCQKSVKRQKCIKNVWKNCQKHKSDRIYFKQFPKIWQLYMVGEKSRNHFRHIFHVWDI